MILSRFVGSAAGDEGGDEACSHEGGGGGVAAACLRLCLCGLPVLALFPARRGAQRQALPSMGSWGRRPQVAAPELSPNTTCFYSGWNPRCGADETATATVQKQRNRSRFRPAAPSDAPEWQVLSH